MRKLPTFNFTDLTNSSATSIRSTRKMIKPFLVLFAMLFSFSMFAQVDLADGQAAIEEAATGIEEYFDPIRNLVVRLVIL